MVQRIPYFGRRAISVLKIVTTPVGIVASIAATLGVVALIVGGTAALWLAATSLVGWLLAVLTIVDRLRVNRNRFEQKLSAAPSTKPAAIAPPPAGAHSSTVASPSVEERRVNSARRALVASVPARMGESLAAPAPSELAAERDPLVTVVVPCYNESRFLPSCLESVQNQTYGNWECIVVDDASTDDSVGAAWQFARSDKRIRVMRHTRNAGLSASRNTGLRLARGELVTFLDSDDFLTEDSLEDRVRHFAPHSGDSSVAGVFCGTMLAPEDAEPADYAEGRKWSKTAVDFVTSGDHCPFNVHAALVRTSVVLAAGGFDESMLHGAEDWDLWYRVLRNGYRFEPSGLLTAIYRQKTSSMRQRLATEHFDEAVSLTAASQLPADESIVFSAEAGPMLKPKSHYEISARLARRAIQSAGTSLIAGNEEGAVAALEALGAVHPCVMSRHVQPETAIRDGIRRYLGLMPNEIAKLSRDVEPLVGHAAGLVSRYVLADLDAHEPRRRSVDMVLLPQTASQLETMAEAIRGATASVAVVDSSVAVGDQGVAEALDAAVPAGAEVFSYNEAVLKPLRSAVVVVSYPREPALEELAAEIAGDAGVIVALRTDLDDVLIVDGVAPSRLAAFDVSAQDFAVACSNGSLQTLLREMPAPSVPADEIARGLRVDLAGAWVVEEYPLTRFDAEDIARFRGIHEGERVVIIGNGPSLNELDLSLMRGTHTIGVNGIFYADDQFAEPLSYYVVEDTAVVQDNLERIRTYEAGHRFFPSIYREMIGESDNTTFFMMNRGFYAAESPSFCVPKFSTNPVQRLYSGQSVTIMNLQLAYFMGFSEVVLIGMDFSYSVPDSAQVDGVLITSMEDDPNHFHPEYFGKGKVWKDPKLDRVLANYALAKQMYEADGRRIVNATPGGNLNLFDRVSYSETLKS